MSPHHGNIETWLYEAKRVILRHFYHDAKKRMGNYSQKQEAQGQEAQGQEAQGQEAQGQEASNNGACEKGARRNRVAVITLVVVWVLSVGVDRVWLALDQLVPSWDPADHLIGALNYAWMVRNADWLSADWWHGIWTLSSKYPPLLYLSTTPFIRWFGSSADVAVGVNVFYTAVLLCAVYGLGRSLFSSTVGLWAAGLCLLFPQFYVLRSQYFMDYPLTAWVTAAFFLLTYWKTRSSTHPFSLQRWLLAIAFGIVFGLALLTKQTALMFLAIPLIWLGIQSLWHRQWSQLVQLILGSAIAGLMMLPWSRTNWVFQISAAFSSNTRSAEIEGDPSALSVEGWTFYISHLPKAISYPLLIT
ncbi:MAG: phospholipid carrier-dependent glycosyltransferase, partial [Leptolyngbyaceae bacterium]|nr:phospholipid carrier-dependent glycosyltransferase [Leptolyngbyaceae bacterium]